MRRYLRLPIPPKNSRGFADLVYLTWIDDPTTTMTIQWHTVKNIAGDNPNQEVLYREEGTAEWQSETGIVHDVPEPNLLIDGGRKVHWTFIKDLKADTGYEFTFAGDVEKVVRKFKTMPIDLNRPIKFTFASDPHESVTHENNPFHEEGIIKIIKEMVNVQPDFIVGGGDYTYSDGKISASNTRWWINLVKKFDEYFVDNEGYLIPFITTVGNHDTSEQTQFIFGEGNAPMFSKLFAFPIMQNYLYGSLEFGDYLQLLSLDSGHGNPIEDCTNWLEETIDPSKKHVIPFYHRPFYEYRGVREAFYEEAIEQWMPIFEENRVKVALNGHLHNYSVTKPILNNEVVSGNEGIVYCGNGSWGLARSSYDFQEPIPEYVDKHAWSDYNEENVHHFYLLTLYDEKIKVESINRKGVKFDEFERLV